MPASVSCRPLVCVSVAAPTVEELRARRDAAEGADLIELRLDALRVPEAAGALAGRRAPVIATCRPRWEGGGFEGSEDARRRVLDEARRLGAEYVDVEWRAGFDDLVRSRAGRGIALSMHTFTGVPADLATHYRAMCATGVEVVKVAVTANRLMDLAPLLELAALEGPRRALLAMGAAGVASRVLAARFGSCWTYAGEGIAPGQLAPRTLLDDFHFRRLAAATTVYAFVGRPAARSLAPVLHNAAFAHLGLDAVCVPLEAADAEDFFALAALLDVQGAAVGAPFVGDLVGRVEVPDEAARARGVLNTLKREGGRWVGAHLVPVADEAAPRTLGGLAMRIAQARRQVAWWTAKEVPARVMEEAAAQTLKERTGAYEPDLV